jgi:type IV pilus assembly protein PilC
VNGGVPISKSLEQFPKTFDSVYINLVRAGESSGSLEKFLEKIAQNIDKKIKIISSLKSAMTYPAILLTVALGVILVMLTYVVPVFAEMYGNMGKQLPAPTQLVMTISDGIRTLWFWAFVALIICFTFYLKYRIKSSQSLSLQFDKLVLSLPVFGGLIQNSTVARIATIVANLISAGVSLIEAVEISRLSITNSYIQEGLENIKREVYAGNTLEKILEKDARFPQTFKAFVSVGEKTGKLNDMMSSIAKYYEEEFDDSVKKMSALLEPVMIVFLGITIGFILVAMYLPIFSMGEGLS